MAELIDKKSALNALNNASYGNFNYVTARNAIDCIRTTTEAEIRAKAIDEFFDELQKYEKDDWLKLKMLSIYHMAEQLKEE